MATLRHLRGAWRTALPDVSWRGMATVIPKVTQVDNSSDFLGNVPHRKHPGIVHLKAVTLPPELIESARFLVADSSMRNVKEQVKALTNYLWSRKRPIEETELLRKAQYLEQKLRGEVGPPKDLLSELDQAKEKKMAKEVLTTLRKTTYHWVALNYTEQLSFLYMAARMDGMYAAVSRAFHEVSCCFSFWRRLWMRNPFFSSPNSDGSRMEHVKPDMPLEGKTTKLRLTYFGHVMQKNLLEKAVLLGLVSGKRKPGRQRTRWLDTIQVDTSLSMERLKETGQGQKTWRELAHRITKSRTRLNG